MINKEKEVKQNAENDSINKTDDLTQKNQQTADNPAGVAPDDDILNIADQTKDDDANTQDIEDQESISDENENNETDPRELLIKELEMKYKETNDKYLRLFSEFDNFRKRMLKEKIELTKTASAEMVEAVLPVLDDLERAGKSAIENPNIEILIEGIGLIQSKLKTTLKQKGLEEIPTIGEAFDTDFHEAITNIPAKEEAEKGKVVDEVQKGYTLNGKILRFAKVVVAN